MAAPGQQMSQLAIHMQSQILADPDSLTRYMVLAMHRLLKS